MDRHRLGEQLRVRHHDEVPLVALDQRDAKADVGDGARLGIERDAIPDPDVALEQDVVAGDVVLQQLLHPERSHHCREQQAEQGDVRVLSRPAKSQEDADDDDQGGDGAACDDDHVCAHLALAQLLADKPRDDPRDDVRRGHGDDDDGRVVDVVRNRNGPASDGGQRHSSVSASSAAGASPSATASPSAGTAASAAGISSSLVHDLDDQLVSVLEEGHVLRHRDV